MTALKLPSWHGERNVKKKSGIKERKIANDLGGKVTKGSGSEFTDKGDIKLEKFLLEHKYTDNKSYSLTKQIFNKIEKEARNVAKLPGMVIEIQDVKLVVLRYQDFA